LSLRSAQLHSEGLARRARSTGHCRSVGFMSGRWPDEVVGGPGGEIVQSGDVMAERAQPPARMRADEARSSGHEHALRPPGTRLGAHRSLPLI
jgi:hypothetical protein